jgi:hypothetical protein
MFVFTLKYDGPLPADRAAKPRAAEKNRIRHVFHQQLEQFWRNHYALDNYAQGGFPDIPIDERRRGATGPFDDKRLWRGGGFWQGTLGPYSFVPLVTRHSGRQCRAEIVLLRPGQPGGLVSSGDLDSRVKTLFDCLRMPHSTRELDGMDQVQAGGRVYCVLEDDSLIGSFAVESGALLLPNPPVDHVSVNIKVTISAPI